MKPPKQSQPSAENPEPDFEQELEEVERSLLSLKERYEQVQRDRQQQAQWQQRRDQLKHNIISDTRNQSRVTAHSTAVGNARSELRKPIIFLA
jgi:small-conductance mechanosensitive channel